jgi:AcrR family transcriptional regulator
VARNEGPGGRPALRRPAVVAAARGLVATQGLAALSIRRLAFELDVSAPALYAHVRDKQDLVGAVADLERDAIAARFRAVADPDPRVHLRRMAGAYVAYSRDEPELFAVVATTPPGLRGSAAEAELVAAATRARANDPAALASAVWAAAHGVATVLRLAPSAAGGHDGELLGAVVDPLLRPAKRGGRGSR